MTVVHELENSRTAGDHDATTGALHGPTAAEQRTPEESWGRAVDAASCQVVRNPAVLADDTGDVDFVAVAGKKLALASRATAR